MATPAPITTVITTTTPQVAAVVAAPVSPPISGFTTILGVTINPMVIVLMVCMVGLGWLAYLAQKSAKPFDLRDLVRDANQKIDIIKTTYLSAFIITSWVIIDQEIKGRLTELIFGGYLAGWVGPLTAKVIFNKDSSKLALPGQGGDHG